MVKGYESPAAASDGSHRRLQIHEEAFEPSGILLGLAGELDVATLDELHETLERTLASEHRLVLVDLTQVTFIDSVSLAAFLSLKRRLPSPRRLAFAIDPDSYATLIFEICGMRPVLDMFDAREQAVAFLRS